jgi:hypothetical protein
MGMTRGVSKRRRLAGSFAMRGDEKNCRRDAGATKKLRSLVNQMDHISPIGIW